MDSATEKQLRVYALTSRTLLSGAFRLAISTASVEELEEAHAWLISRRNGHTRNYSRRQQLLGRIGALKERAKKEANNANPTDG